MRTIFLSFYQCGRVEVAISSYTFRGGGSVTRVEELDKKIETNGKFAAGIVDIGGKFATGINNTSRADGIICHNLPPVPLIPVVHLDFVNISANFRKKFEMTLVLFSGAWGKMIHEKNLK